MFGLFKDTGEPREFVLNYVTFGKLFWSLALVFAFVEFFVNGEAGLFGVRDRERLEVGGGAEAGDELAHRPTTGGAFLERLGRDGAAQREAGAAARLAVALIVAQFVFVNRHRRLAKLPPNRTLGQARFIP